MAQMLLNEIQNAQNNANRTWQKGVKTLFGKREIVWQMFHSSVLNISEISANFSLVLLIKVLLIKEKLVYSQTPNTEFADFFLKLKHK